MSCRTICHGMLSLLLLLSFTVPAYAMEPAVSAVNGQLQGAYGRVDGDDLRVGGASVALPVGRPFGLQVDGAYGELNQDQLKGIGSRFFIRDPEHYRIGIFGAHAELQDIDLNRWGVEGEFFSGPFTFGAMAGHQEGDVDNTGFCVAELRWYPGDNLMLLLGGNLAGHDNDKIFFGGEYQMTAGLSAYAEVAVGENDYDHALVGLRYYFGDRKNLIQRHRQDAVPNPIVGNVLQGLHSIREKQARPAPIILR